MHKKLFYIIIAVCMHLNGATAQVLKNAQAPLMHTQVLVIGGGTGGTAAGVQAARLGINTVIVEPTTWLGGMISAAGVSATDGNHKLPSGLWKEFRDKIYTVYGSAKAVETGWVSNTHFEPHVADSIFKAMAFAEKKLSVLYKWQFEKAVVKANKIVGAIFKNEENSTLQINASVVIDATEMGGVMASAKIPFNIGMEAEEITGEKVGVTASNNIVQDLTYVAILKDYGIAKDCTIVKPVGYDPLEFDGSNTDYYIDKSKEAPNVDSKKMLGYAKLPHNKYMLNWPRKGNDTYLNVVALSNEARQIELEKSKQTTLRFIYFIQQQLGFKNLGLADDEFPTKDKLALIPYYREGRRVKGLVRFNINNIAKPYEGDPLYRTGISVGDYPIDHHHKKNEAAPQHLAFFPVPSYNVPLGALIPEKFDGLIVAEKGISVSNVVNGTTRLQPVVLLTGQAAGVLAGLTVLQNKQPRNISIRNVQEKLLNAGAYIMPYIDASPDLPYFKAIQKIGATGILKGTGIPYKWANQTWFYPDSLITETEFSNGLSAFTGKIYKSSNEILTIKKFIQLLELTTLKESFYAQIKNEWINTGLSFFSENRPIKRFEIAVILDKYLQPFETNIDYKGNFRKNKTK
jgi:hypothetical protein